jgi:PKD repeat protein
MDLCFTDPNVMYAATFPGWWDAKHLYRTTDGGENWTEITPPEAMLNGSLWVPFDIAVSALDPDVLWIVRTSMYGGTNLNGSVVFYSDDGGVTWTNYTSNLPTSEACTSISHHWGSDGGVYIGTRRAVYYRNNTMSEWQLYSTGLPATTVSVRLIPYYGKQTLRNGTNRSVWERDFYENAGPIAQASVSGAVKRCLADTVQYFDHSVISDQNAIWTWAFPGGIPANSTERDPKVLYSEPGIYDITLEVSDDFGTDIRTFSAIIKMVDECGLDTVPGFAMKSTGSPDYAIIPDMGMTIDSFTITAWINPDGVQSDYSAVVMNDGSTAGLNFRGGNNTLGYHWPGGSWSWNSGLVVPSGVWSHVAMVVTTSEIRLYLNGVEAIHNTSPDPVTMETVRIGSYKGWASRNYKGLIDEVSMYDRALSKEEIRGLRHLTLDPANDISLVSYYQFNEDGGIVYDKAGGRDALLNGSASKVRSRAPIGGGHSQYMDVTGIGTYVFGDVGVTLDFESGSITPDGDLFISRICVAPDTVRHGVGRLANGYWIFNNYGVNQSIQFPITMTFDPIGFVSDSMATFSEPLLLGRSENAELVPWLDMNKTTEIFSGVKGSLVAGGFGIFVPGQVMFIRDSFPIGTPMVSVGEAGYIKERRGGESVAFDLSTGSGKGLGLPVLTADQFEALPSPQKGMLAYHRGEKALCFFNDSVWMIVEHSYIDLVPLVGANELIGVAVDSQWSSSAILSLGGGGLVLPNAIPDSDLIDIDYPPTGLLIYRLSTNEIEMYDGAAWRSMTTQVSGMTVNANAPSISYPGIAVGTVDKSPGAVLEISASKRGLGVPVVEIATIASPIEGLCVFDPIRGALCFFDGQSWQLVLMD